MAELEKEETIDATIEDADDNSQEFDSEDVELFKRFNIDPETASIDDLKALARRAYKAEKKVVDEKRKAPIIKTETNQDLEMRLFFIENPEYKESKEGIMDILSQDKYKNLTPQEALLIYNSNKPKESKTTLVNIGGGYKEKPKQLSQLSEEEAIKLSPNEYIKYLTAKGELR